MEITAGKTTLSPQQMQCLLCGNTLHLALADGRRATLFFDPDGRVDAIMPDGTRDSGDWTLQAGGYCISWVKGPRNSCTSIAWMPGRIELSDTAGKPRGTVERIAPGEDPALSA